ncbi:MAG: hypothetical protein B6D46_10190 [Polyangiaceae bacterium UTPRO1]|nr:hypothetical protein [Myxococcales bacterium]OQY66533.1 MAG: hypothetical protein B6D46_10190 [Polyangiaceae bacterium UTPRO1]
MRIPIAIVIAVVAAAPAPPVAAQSITEPATIRAVVKCGRAVGKAARAFTATKLASVQKCLDTVSACLQLKPGDGGCAAKAAALCAKQMVRSQQAGVKLREALRRTCSTAALPYDVLRSSAALDIDGLGAACRRFGVDPEEKLDDYAECILRIADCSAADILEAGTPRADALLAGIGYDLRADVCPTPAAAPTPTPTMVEPTAAVTSTAAPPVATPTLAVTSTAASTAASPTPVVTSTAAPTAEDTAAEQTPTPAPSATPSPLPTTTPTPMPFNIAFVTSTTHNGNFGGLEGADAICGDLAAAAGLGGTYVAWLSTATVTAASRLAGARGFVRPDGEPLADLPLDLAESRIFNAIHLDEYGSDVGAAEVWTGTKASGGAATDTCGDWTAASNVKGTIGNSAGGPAAWTDSGAASACAQPRHHYCFGIGMGATALGPAVTSGKIVFITSGTMKPSAGGGLASADTMCALEAAGAHLPGTYKALLATTTAGAAARIDPAALYVRPDGTFIADGATLAAGGVLASGIWQRPTGEYLGSYSDVAWSGAATPSEAGTASSTCGDFASGTGSGFFGRATLITPTWWQDAMTSRCDLGHHVYCVEQ